MYIDHVTYGTRILTMRQPFKLQISMSENKLQAKLSQRFSLVNITIITMIALYIFLRESRNEKIYDTSLYRINEEKKMVKIELKDV